MTLRKITAAQGMVLTNGEAFGREIYLGVNDSPENWREVPEAQAPVEAAQAAEEDYQAALGEFGVEL